MPYPTTWRFYHPYSWGVVWSVSPHYEKFDQLSFHVFGITMLHAFSVEIHRCSMVNTTHLNHLSIKLGLSKIKVDHNPDLKHYVHHEKLEVTPTVWDKPIFQMMHFTFFTDSAQSGIILKHIQSEYSINLQLHWQYPHSYCVLCYGTARTPEAIQSHLVS
jgi:hypothetical protein